MRKLFVTLVTVAVLLAAAPAVSAGGWKDQPGELTITAITCDDVVYSGAGFTPGAFVWFNEWTGDGVRDAAVGPGVTVAADGTFSVSWDPWFSRCNQQSGTERTGKALTQVERGNSGRLVTVEIDRATFFVP